MDLVPQFSASDSHGRRSVCTVPLVYDSLRGPRVLWYAIHSAALAPIAGWHCGSLWQCTCIVVLWPLAEHTGILQVAPSVLSCVPEWGTCCVAPGSPCSAVPGTGVEWVWVALVCTVRVLLCLRRGTSWVTLGSLAASLWTQGRVGVGCSVLQSPCFPVSWSEVQTKLLQFTPLWCGAGVGYSRSHILPLLWLGVRHALGCFRSPLPGLQVKWAGFLWVSQSALLCGLE